jgi:hypothetical protein
MRRSNIVWGRRVYYRPRQKLVKVSECHLGGCQEWVVSGHSTLMPKNGQCQVFLLKIRNKSISVTNPNFDSFAFSCFKSLQRKQRFGYLYGQDTNTTHLSIPHHTHHRHHYHHTIYGNNGKSIHKYIKLHIHPKHPPKLDIDFSI